MDGDTLWKADETGANDGSDWSAGGRGGRSRSTMKLSLRTPHIALTTTWNSASWEIIILSLWRQPTAHHFPASPEDIKNVSLRHSFKPRRKDHADNGNPIHKHPDPVYSTLEHAPSLARIRPSTKNLIEDLQPYRQLFVQFVRAEGNCAKRFSVRAQSRVSRLNVRMNWQFA